MLAGAESRLKGRGGASIVSESSGMTRETVKKGRREVAERNEAVKKHHEVADEPISLGLFRIAACSKCKPSVRLNFNSHFLELNQKTP